MSSWNLAKESSAKSAPLGRNWTSSNKEKETPRTQLFNLAVFCRCVEHVYRNRILDSEPFNFIESTFLKQVAVVKLGMKPPTSLRSLLKRHGYSDETVEAIWKWYDIQSSSVEISKTYIGLTPKIRSGLRWIYGISLR
jgi:hypothetical protein